MPCERAARANERSCASLPPTGCRKAGRKGCYGRGRGLVCLTVRRPGLCVARCDAHTRIAGLPAAPSSCACILCSSFLSCFLLICCSSPPPCLDPASPSSLLPLLTPSHVPSPPLLYPAPQPISSHLPVLINTDHGGVVRQEAQEHNVTIVTSVDGLGPDLVVFSLARV